MSVHDRSDNRFLFTAPARLFALQAVPMILVMLMNGLLSVVDAAFLGHFVGAKAMAAVSIAFPAVMIATALSTLVSGGMSSLYARQLGRQELAAAGRHFRARAWAGADHRLCGRRGVSDRGAARGSMPRPGRIPPWEEAAHVYLLITPRGRRRCNSSLGLHADAWRNEGRVGLMAVLSVGVTLANIAANYLLIVTLGLGVAGSALGTVLAQGMALATLLGLRWRGGGVVALATLGSNRWTGGWGQIACLGAPLSLSFIGIAAVSTAVIVALGTAGTGGHAQSLAAYGIVTRVFGFAFLPLIGMALATQSIIGNLVGAGHFQRSNASLRIALISALVYCLAVEAALLFAGQAIGTVFIDESPLRTEVGQILRVMGLLYLASGPTLVLALYFQAVGQPARAALLTMVKPFVLLPLLIFAFARFAGVEALWRAFPVADGLIALLAGAVAVSALLNRPPRGGFGLPEPRPVA